ncbi:MAG: serine/threonine protein kinase [Lentisphaeraceae bacterium]|nr:serine/threonine protein kinase [Lentisphaeraceae bacterium]
MNLLHISKGRYLNLNEFDAGGMKAIYKCFDSHTDRNIVLVAPKDAINNELFVREGFINAFLQHPSISPVYDIGILEDDRPYFTSKLISGSPLNELSQNKTHEEVVDILIKICEAISYAHSRSIIHQDLKPDNIMIDSFGEVIIIDWGLAEIDDSSISGENSILDKELQKLKLYTIPDEFKKLRGTPGFIAPERYEGSEGSRLSDIYSIGALLYSMVSGEELDEAKSRALAYPQNTPTGLKAICKKSLSPKPEQRYQTVKELLGDLQLYRNGYATEAESASIWRTLTLLYSRNKRFFQVLFLALVFICAATVLSFILINESKNIALSEKDKAIKANENNLRLVDALKRKETSRQHFMRLSAKNQLFSIRQLLRKGKLDEIGILLEATLKLDPESKENQLFKAQFELACLRLESSIQVYENLGKYKPIELLKNIDPRDSQSLLKNMPKLAGFLPGDLGILLATNCLKLSKDLNTKAEFYEWLIFFTHTGMKRMPVVKIDLSNQITSIEISNQFNIKDCGPIHLLRPQKINLSNTNFLKIGALFKCQILVDLNLSNTPLISLADLQLRSLKKLNISKTVIKTFDVTRFPQLESLNVAHASFKGFRFLKGLPKLKTLIVDKTQLPSIKKITDLEVIVVED